MKIIIFPIIFGGQTPPGWALTLETDVTGAYYTGKAITIDSFKKKYVVVDKAGKVLTEGKDYRLEYTNNVDAGKASVVAYGIGNHATTDKDGKPVAIADCRPKRTFVPYSADT